MYVGLVQYGLVHAGQPRFGEMGFGMADDDGPIVLGVSDYLQIDARDREEFPITVEVGDQLMELLRAHPGTRTEALFTAIMTTVGNLERESVDLRLELTEAQINVMTLNVNGMALHSALRMLHLELLMNGVEVQTELPDWIPARYRDHDNYPDD